MSILSLLSPHVCLCAPAIWYEVRAWAGVKGWMVSFGIDLFYYVCARHAVHLLHTQEKQPLPGCCWAQCLKTAQIMQDTAEWEQELFCLTFFFFFFLTGLWIFAPTTLKSILYLLGYKSFLWTQKVFRECACRVSDVRTFLYHLSHWFSATLVAYVLLNAKRVT